MVLGDTVTLAPIRWCSWLHRFAFCCQMVPLSDSYVSNLMYNVRFFSCGMHLGYISGVLAVFSLLRREPSIPSE